MKILNRLFSDVKIDTNKPIQNIRQKDSTQVTSKYTYEEEKIKAIFDKHDQPLSKETLGEIKLFMAKTDGDFESKVETIESSLVKGIEITADNLSAVFEALNGGTEEIVKELRINPLDEKKVYSALPKDLRKAVDLKVNEGLSLKDAVKEVISEELKKLFSEEKSEIPIDDKNFDVNVSSGAGLTNAFVDTEVKTYIESDITATKALNKTNHQEIGISRMNFEESDDLEKDIEIVKTVENALELVEEGIDKLLEQIDGNVQIDSLVNFESDNSFKKVIRTEITEKMVELKREFTEYKNLIDKQLDKLINEKPVLTNMKENLNSVIDKLDKILMKSEITLHTDMKTERDLLASSSKLDNARVLLDKGETKEVIEIVKEVKSLIKQIDFKPSEQKVFGVSQKMFFEKLYDNEIIKNVPINVSTDAQVSPRSVLELLRGLGLNHESEMSEIINKEKSEDSVKYTQNMKTILMKLEEDVTQRVTSKDGLDNLTGQQLMNKLEYKSQKQKLLFNIPINISDDIKNLKIHVNAKKDNQKIDWKNSTLYFVIHLEKLGDTGMLVDVNNGQLNLTIKNDTPDIESKMKPLVESAMKRLETAGFTHFKLTFESLSENTKNEPVKQKIVMKQKEIESKEGFDVRI